MYHFSAEKDGIRFYVYFWAATPEAATLMAGRLGQSLGIILTSKE